MRQSGFVRSYFPLIVSALLAIALVWWWALSAAHAAEPLAFKGLALGVSAKELKKRYPKVDCSIKSVCMLSNAPGSDRPVDTIGGAPITMMLFRLHEGKLELITMSIRASDVDAVAEAIRGRHGSPLLNTADPELASRMTWVLKDAEITLERGIAYASHLGSVTYRTRDAALRAAERLRNRDAKAKSDL